MGELVVHDSKSSVQTTTDLQAFALLVTAEPYFAVTQPSDLVVAQNLIGHDTKGGVEPVDVRFELISRDTYNSQVQPINSPVYEVSNKTPLDLLEARNAVRIAKDAGAGQYASAERRFSPNRKVATNSSRETRPCFGWGWLLICRREALALSELRRAVVSAELLELWCLLNSYCTQRSVLFVYLRERESNSRADIGAKNPNGRDPKGGSRV